MKYLSGEKNLVNEKIGKIDDVKVVNKNFEINSCSFAIINIHTVLNISHFDLIHRNEFHNFRSQFQLW